MTTPALAVHGRGLVPADEPVLRADDLGVQRGDGIFETARVCAGRVVKLDRHLARLQAGAARMQLAAPDADAWRALAADAVAASGAGDGLLKLVCTRGPEGGPVTAFAMVLPVPPAVIRGREDGVRAVTLTLGIAAGARADAPWLLGGVKTTSYAVNLASLREAEARGAADVVWLSSDGYVLEAPTATVCWVRDGVVHTPPADTGVLEGTTEGLLESLLPDVEFRRTAGRLDDLRAADEIMLVSSVRGVAPVLALDDVPVGAGAVGPVTARLRAAYEAEVARS